MSSQCLAVMSCYCISVYPPHLSTMGTRSFIILPLPAMAVFSRCTKSCARDAVGSLLRGLSSCMDVLIRRWEWALSGWGKNTAHPVMESLRVVRGCHQGLEISKIQNFTYLASWLFCLMYARFTPTHETKPFTHTNPCSDYLIKL